MRTESEAFDQDPSGTFETWERCESQSKLQGGSWFAVVPKTETDGDVRSVGGGGGRG